MPENKTKPTDERVEAYLSAIEDGMRRKAAKKIAVLMTKITGHPPRMWGASIVGFDNDHYRYDSGREGDAPVTGFPSGHVKASTQHVACTQSGAATADLRFWMQSAIRRTGRKVPSRS